ncbi:MAG: DUF2252 domain-containing protein [Pseudomonadota bacterium]|nr:DUF2252 domain-containing protein [Pseudomonadota bacterium]
MSAGHSKTIAPARRAEALNARRNLKMASSAHAYVRGSTVQFYRWLEEHGKRAVPKGPPVWICGDCHAGNLGPLAAADGKVHVQIRDLDQTVIGNPNHDLIRLALSLCSAARGSDLPGVTTAHMLEQMMIGYRSGLHGTQNRIESDKPQSIKVVVRRATARTWRHLARDRLEDVKPTIPRGERFWPLTKLESQAIAATFEQNVVRKLVTSLKSRSDDAAIEVLDAAYWMKGCSSLGRLRFAVLLSVAGGKKRDHEFCLVDIKEAAPAAAPHAARAVMPNDRAQRIVEGAKHLSPALGERMMASKLLKRSVVIRELMPQDLKLEIDQLSRKEAVNCARYLAEVVGKAHARQMDTATRREFASSFKQRKSAQLSAPSWLWSSVVELASAHEAAYLEHCRRYSLQA